MEGRTVAEIAAERGADPMQIVLDLLQVGQRHVGAIYFSMCETATYVDPHQFPRGVEHVIVNGTLVVKDGEHTGALPGQVVRLS